MVTLCISTVIYNALRCYHVKMTFPPLIYMKKHYYVVSCWIHFKYLLRSIYNFNTGQCFSWKLKYTLYESSSPHSFMIVQTYSLKAFIVFLSFVNPLDSSLDIMFFLKLICCVNREDERQILMYPILLDVELIAALGILVGSDMQAVYLTKFDI